MVRAFVLAVLLLPSVARAAGDDRGKHHSATRTPSPPRIDGRLDDDVWQLAPADDRFRQNFPDEGKPPTQRTELRVLYDDQALYIAVRAWDDNAAAIVPRLTRRDRETDADQIEVDIDSRDDHTTGYRFSINCAGVLVDGVHFNDVDYSGDWDGLWLGAATRDDKGWSAELAIPLKTLRYEAKPGHTWFGFEVRRLIQRRQEWDEWALVPRSARGEVSYYGILDGLRGLRTKRLFQIVPYLAGGLYTRYSQAPLDGVSLYENIGADLKVGLTPALTLDATINPDFGQVEADQVVLNLTTFEVFFPEKRPFFLEGVDIFATPIALFYSRRIGHAPIAPDSYNIAEPLPQGRIWGAAKLTGIIAPRLTIGVLDAVTDRMAVEATPLAGGSVRSVGLEPLANYAVLRLRRDILARSYVGVMATAVTRFERPFDAAPLPGDLCPDDAVALTGIITPTLKLGRCFHDAYTGGVDANLVTKSGAYGVRAQAVGSVIAGGPVRYIADGTKIGPGDTGVGFSVDGGKQAGRSSLRLHYEGYSPKLDLSDAGYNRQANLQWLRPEVGYRMVRPQSAFLEGNVSVGNNTRLTWDGASVLQEQLYFNSWLHWRNFWMTYVEVDWDANHTDVRETRDGARLERAGGWSFALWLKTDSRKKLVFQTTGVMSRVKSGLSFDGNMQWSLRLIPPLEIDLIPHATWTFGDPRWYDTVYGDGGARTYYLAELESRSFDVTFRGTYTFAPNLTLQAYAQLFIDGGHFGQSYAATVTGADAALPFSAFRQAAMPSGQYPDFRDGAVNVNVVLRWELVPGTTLLGVYTHSSLQPDYDATREPIGAPSFRRFSGGPGTDLFLVKLALLLS
jgi:hypothetical protein